MKNTDDRAREVTSMDLEPEHGNIGPNAIRPVKFYSRKHMHILLALDPTQEVGIPIVKLGKNQSVYVKCHALKGFGKMHAKWSPVNIATFT